MIKSVDVEVTVGEADHVGDELAAETGHRDAHGDDAGDAAGVAELRALVLGEPRECEDEEERGDDVGRLDEGLDHVLSPS